MRLNWICVPLVVHGVAMAAKPLPECSNARPKAACVITIDARDKLVPGPTTVTSGTNVTIRVVNKGPLDQVKFKMDRAAATPPENPLATILTTFNASAVLKALGAVTAASTEAVHGANKGLMMLGTSAGERTAPADPIRRELAALRERIRGGAGELVAIEKTYSDLKAVSATLPSCADVAACKNAANHLADAIQQSIAQGVPTFEDETASLKAIDASIAKLPPERRADYRTDRDAMAAAIQAQQFAADELFKAQAGLNSLAAALRRAADGASTEELSRVPADSNTDTTVHVTFSPDGDAVEVPVVIHFQNWAWATPSAGVAFTSFRRNSYRVVKHSDPTLDPDPTKQSYATIQRDEARRQVIPVSLVNFQTRWTTIRCHGYDVGFTASVGVGVNVSTQEAEFLAGPGLHIGRAQFMLGAHWARSVSLINGFTEGQRVAADLAPPVANPYSAHWSVSVTYRLR